MAFGIYGISKSRDRFLRDTSWASEAPTEFGHRNLGGMRGAAGCPSAWASPSSSPTSTPGPQICPPRLKRSFWLPRGLVGNFESVRESWRLRRHEDCGADCKLDRPRTVLTASALQRCVRNWEIS